MQRSQATSLSSFEGLEINLNRCKFVKSTFGNFSQIFLVGCPLFVQKESLGES